jgi:hypothetical protein
MYARTYVCVCIRIMRAHTCDRMHVRVPMNVRMYL